MAVNGYTRQALADTAAGLVIKSADINAEFNQVQSAMDNSSGHDHSGSASGTGQPITINSASMKSGTSTANQVLIAGAASGSAPAWSNIASLLTAGTGITLSGTTNATITLKTPTSTTNIPANPAATTSAAAVMAGMAGTFTPISTGRLLIIIDGSVSNDTASGTANWQIYYGTGVAPANGAGTTGTALDRIKFMTNNANTASLIVPFSVTAVAIGLTLNTAYWIDLAFFSGTAGTSTALYNISIDAIEI